MDYIYLSYLNSKPFLVRSSNDASGDKFLPANEDTTPVFPFIPSGSFFSLRIDRSTIELLRKNSLKEADSRSLNQFMTGKNGFVTLFHIQREKRLR